MMLGKASTRDWKTPLLSLEACEESYSSFLHEPASVNGWRLMASLAALDPPRQKAFLSWAKNPKNRREGYGETFARECIGAGQTMRYHPACELWEDLHVQAAKADEANEAYDQKTWSQRQHRYWRDAIDIAGRHGLIAHGTKNSLIYEGLRELKETRTKKGRVIKYGLKEMQPAQMFLATMEYGTYLDRQWAQLNIAVEGTLTDGSKGPLSWERYDVDAPAMYGPHYLIFDPAGLKKNPMPPHRRRTHLMYLEPDDACAVFMADGIRAAHTRKMMPEQEAIDASSKVITYRELVENQAGIPRLLEGKITPARLAGRE